MQWMNPDVARKVFRKANVNVGPSRDGRVEMLQACARGHSIKTVWPSGLRRWLQAPVRKGVGSNPTAVILFSFQVWGARLRECNANYTTGPSWKPYLRRPAPTFRARMRFTKGPLKCKTCVVGRILSLSLPPTTFTNANSRGASLFGIIRLRMCSQICIASLDRFFPSEI